MRACLRNLLLVGVVVLLSGWAILSDGGAPPKLDCGIAAWTGTCACSTDAHAAPVSLQTLARSLRAPDAARTLDRARRECEAHAGL